MKKCIKKFLVSALTLMMLVMLTLPAFAVTDDVELTITPNVENISSSTSETTIIYTVKIKPIGNAVKIGSVDFNLKPSEGVTLATEGFTFSGESGVFNTEDYDVSIQKYTSVVNDALTTECTLFTIKATVAAGTTGEVFVGLENVVVGADDGETVLQTKAVIKSTTITAPHTHTYTSSPNKWDENNHWYECTDNSCPAADKGKKDVTAHSGGTATCTTQATCEVCHQLYGNLAEHSFTKNVVNNNTLKSAGTCTAEAVYYYTCANCPEVSTTLTFTGEKDPTNHSGTLGTEWKTSSEKHWHEYPCCNAKADVATHTPGEAATETTPQTCTECGYVIAPATGHIRHTLTKHSANPATCTEAGNIEYWTCSGCNDKFSDADGTNKITGSVTIAALGHDHNGPWVTTDENEHWKVCAREGCNEQLDKAVHTPSAWVNVGDGYHHQTCTVCERELTHEVCTFGQPLKYNATSHWEECTKCGNKQNEAAHEFLPDSDKCTGCDYTKSSTITIITPTQPGDSKPAEGNPSTGAVSSPVGYIAIGLAVVGALCLGAKKLTKKHED